MSAILAILMALRGLGIHCEVAPMNVSAYVNSGGVYPYQGLTASGQYTRPGVAACGKALFDARAHLYVPGVGWVACLDRGSEITDGHVDVWFSDEGAALQFGRQSLPVIVAGGEK